MRPRDASPETGRGLAERLYRETADVTRCVWPGCELSLQHYRIGPLCAPHANDVAEALAAARAAPITNAQVAAEFRRQSERAAAEARARSRATAPGWIYYLRIGDRIKIGYSRDVKRRMRAYPPDSKLLAVHPGTPQMETEMHQRFAGSRAAGREWFNETVDLREHIAAVIAQFGDPRQHRHQFRRGAARV